MAVEYAGILAAVSLMAITLTGAYGKNVTAVFNSSSVGVAAVAKRRRRRRSRLRVPRPRTRVRPTRSRR